MYALRNYDFVLDDDDRVYQIQAANVLISKPGEVNQLELFAELLQNKSEPTSFKRELVRVVVAKGGGGAGSSCGYCTPTLPP